MKIYTVKENYTAVKNSVIDTVNLSEFIDLDKFDISKAWINVGGWQSWNPGVEVEPGKKQPALTCHLIKGWNNYLVFPESEYIHSKNIVLGQFVTYLRWNDFYLVFASVGNVSDVLPPVQFIINRKEKNISFEIYDKGTSWNAGEITAKIEIFTADSYFECKEKLQNLFGGAHFNNLEHLGENPAGWESWYNHYSNINEQLIFDNLHSLSNEKNIISNGNFSSKVFQIDDGWEKALGDWEVRTDRFPGDFKSIVNEIESRNYIPGLWLAPFIIDSRSKTATEHPDWLLCDENGNKIISGYNPLWGEKGNFYCLDLSNDEVLHHLDIVMDRVINEWGFRYIKLDFLYAGLFYGQFKNKSSAYKNYDKAIKFLTSRKETLEGKKVAYLGCGVPFESSFKYFPLSRIGCDTLEHWKNKTLRLINWNGRNEAYLNLKDTLGHSLWNKTIFYNDPDVVFIRENNCSLSDDEKKLIAFINIVFGSQFMYSDDPSIKATDRENLVTSEIQNFLNKYKNVHFGEKQISKDVYEIFSDDKKYTGQINLKKHTFKIVEAK